MRKTALFLISIVITASWSAFADPTIACPTDKSGKSITDWRTAAIQKLVTAGSLDAYTEVQNDLKECFSDKVPSCMNDLKYYAHYKPNPISTYDMDALYNKSMELQSESFLPKELTVTNVVGEVSKGYVKIPANFHELAKEKNWLTTSYKTRELGGFDNSNNLFLMVFPSEKRDTVLQLSIAKDTDPYASAFDPIVHPFNGNMTQGFDILTMITVDKTKNPPIAQLRILRKDYLQEDTYLWDTKNSNTSGTRACIGCHASPFRAISPVGYRFTNSIKTNLFTGDEKPMDKEQKEITDKVNEIMNRPGISWGSTEKDGREIRFGQDLDSQPWGWAPADSETRKKEFIEQCASERKAISSSSRAGGHYRVDLVPDINAVISWEKISKAMNCISCHNGKSRGIIHNDFSPSTVAFKIAITREMPESDDPENPLPPELNADERMALVWCLQKERSTVAKAWKESGWWMQRSKCK
ncbi:MAG: hypothetical protein B7Y39_19190 [Bdellovibrio sp. 28-41-41]|nr:MAG: hypothetical protein B7Y39_19190 [Bdellovibrio sp. 28-41-41]